MVIDTSAIVAVFLQEADAEGLLLRMAQARMRLLSAASYVECGIVLSSRAGSEERFTLGDLILRTRVKVVPLTEDHAVLTRSAFLRFGKGRHPAGLNFGGCFSYALAKAVGEPLLCKGEDFRRTDLVLAV